MLHKTKGIVLKITDYAENSIIAKILTQKFGMQTYMINGVKKPKAKIRLNMLQPLHLLDMVVYHKPNGNMQRISDARSEPILQTIPYDILKSSLVMFINEMIYKSVKEQHEDEMMFEFIFKSIEWLDAADEGITNFHLIFLSKLTRFLGFYPDMSTIEKSAFFDLKHGVFTRQQPSHIYLIEEQFIKKWIDLFLWPLDDFNQFKLDQKSRKYFIKKLIDYYTLQIENFGEVKSHLILEEVLE
ncbi:MAG: DNA repair protein RecO [Bacteroidetes bacterium]|nr:DNA repair protein RecO [Bacteroidota bacterium]MBU1371535.1 DNA repair protein RecO [Bacteroidota bacterium]MBU1485154.1 DNA repair protein RecO [Bacteroidota bacterium]MBU1760373.1 DNA repair protein RecO [Bacteroidota bacterium]MBU2266615.1 DNA repair protein RecO [Bacteroidota bacterium]